MTVDTFSWPAEAPTHGQVRLRAFEDRDVDMVVDLATDSYVPKIGSLPFRATHQQVQDYIARQRGRLAEGKGFSFCVADRTNNTALGMIGLWLTARSAPPRQPASPGRGFCAAIKRSPGDGSTCCCMPWSARRDERPDPVISRISPGRAHAGRGARRARAGQQTRCGPHGAA